MFHDLSDTCSLLGRDAQRAPQPLPVQVRHEVGTEARLLHAPAARSAVRCVLRTRLNRLGGAEVSHGGAERTGRGLAATRTFRGAAHP
jgi:hypothetical protein